MSKSDSALGRSANSKFASTRWSLVLAAGAGDSEESRNAMAALCEAYWYPLYAFVRREGQDRAAAADLTQGFFTQMLEKNTFGDVSPDRGRFRSYLLASMKHFIINQWDRGRALKRGGGQQPISFDFSSAEGRYLLEPVDETTPESLFDRQWALTLLERVQVLLARRYASNNKTRLYEALRNRIGGAASDMTYGEIAERLEMTESAVKVAVHRMRQQFRQILRGEISQTVSDDAEIDEEIADLFAILRR